MAVSLEQQRALAMASARMRMADAEQQKPDSGPTLNPLAATLMARAVTSIMPRVAEGMGAYGVPEAVANGATFGFEPNIKAGGKALAAKTYDVITGAKNTPSMGEYYDRTLTAEQEARRKFREDKSKISIPSEIAGGFLTGAGLVKNGVNFAKLAGAKSFLPKMAANAVEGAAYGGLAGFGGGEGSFENRVQGAKDNAPLGALLGAAVQPVANAVGGVTGVAKNWWDAFINPIKHGEDLLIRRIMQDNTTPQKIAEAVRDARSQGVEPYTAIDAAGQNTRKLGGLAARTPGEFREKAVNFADSRQYEQNNRVSKYVDDALGVKGADAFATEEQLIASRKAEADPLYEEAFKNPAPTSQTYIDLLTRPSVKDKLAGLEKLAAEDNRPYSDLMTDNPAAQGEMIPTVRGWEALKRMLDDEVNSLYSSGKGYAGSVVKGTRDTVRSQLKEDFPAIKQASDIYSDKSSSLEAIKAGRDIVKARNADELTALIRKLSEDKKDMARIGAAREFGVAPSNNPLKSDSTAKFNTPNARQKIDLLAKNPEDATQFQHRLDLERNMTRANNELTTGARTSGDMLENNDIYAGNALAALFSGNLGRASALMFGRGADFLRAGANGLNEKAATTVGDYLINPDPAKIEALADMFAKTQNAANLPSKGQALAIGINLARQGDNIPKPWDILKDDNESQKKGAK